ncbi:MAG TPA: CHRD domain-containing protein [Ignavibacteriales bacterium]|nr:CHRD domain-containing protein [Ignavibacteriales bacterium]
MRKISGLIASVLFLLISSMTAYSQTYFAARLSQAQQIQSGSKTDSVDRGYTGTAIVVLNSDSTNNMTLNYIVTVGRGTPGNDTSQTGGGTAQNDSVRLRAIYFNLGTIGDTGTTVLSVTSGITGNSYSGTLNAGGSQALTQQVVDALLEGKIFVIAVLDSGRIRGHIHPVTGAGFVAHLTAPQETDSVKNSKASGVGSFLLTDLGLIYQISVQGIDIQASHIHKGMPGIAGPVVFPITFSGHTAMGLWKQSDQSNPLNKDLLTMLLTEGLYVNVHSPTYPSGEIRGQILHAAGFGFSSPLKSSRSTQGGQTGGKSDSTKRVVGGGTYTLTDFGLVYHINIRGTSVNNIYFANTSTNQKLKDIPKFSDTTYSGVWFSKKAYETTPLAGTQIADLIQGKVSLVVETGNDTLRGVIMLHKQTNFSALLSGPQETPRHMIHPTGGGHFILTPSGLQYYITIAGIDSIAGAHFHMAPMGVSGPIVHPITFDSTFTAQGTWDLTPEQGSGMTTDMITALLEGNIYVNVHTRRYPAGEIRGQLVPASGTDFTTHLEGNQVVPATTEKAMGTGNFILTNEGLIYKITVDSLKVTGVRIEHAPFGVTGTVVSDLQTAGFDTSNTIIGVWRRTGGTSPLTDQLITSLLRGNLYVNLLTSANPNGAIRGQILPNGGTGFIAVFDSATAGQNQTASKGYGNGMFVLTDAGLIYDISVAGYKGNGGNFTNGQGGASLFQMPQTFNGGSTNGVWMMLNDTTAAAGNIAALFNNTLYVSLTGGPTAPIGKTFTPNPTSVKLVKETPESFDLAQNYPNPFNPTTTIRFSIPQAGPVSLNIFNMLGEKVATLVDGQLRAGRYEVSFDGSKVASGVYFYRISFQNSIVTRKMMLIK